MSREATPFQPDASANAPCTSTTVGFWPLPLPLPGGACAVGASSTAPTTTAADPANSPRRVVVMVVYPSVSGVLGGDRGQRKAAHLTSTEQKSGHRFRCCQACLRAKPEFTSTEYPPAKSSCPRFSFLGRSAPQGLR